MKIYECQDCGEEFDDTWDESCRLCDECFDSAETYECQDCCTEFTAEDAWDESCQLCDKCGELQELQEVADDD
jgi:hypothetical protein